MTAFFRTARCAPPGQALRRRQVNYRHRDAADADQLIGTLLRDADFPDLGGAAHVQGPGATHYVARFHASNVIGVDFEAHAGLLGAVDAGGGPDATQGFGQRHRGAAVQQAHRLVRAAIHGHPALDILLRKGGQLNAEGIGQGGALAGPAFDVVEGHGEGGANFGQSYLFAAVPIQQIYLLRHGQTDFNVQGIVQGSGVNSDLNDQGRRQAALFWARYKAVPFSRIYTSRLKRTQQSVQRFLDLGIPHESLPALNEISWGTREGTRVTPQEDAEYGGVLAEWLAGNEHARLPGGESPAQVAARQRPFIELLASRPQDEIVLVCMHGRALRVLLCQLLGYPLRCMDGFEHHNLGLYKLHYTGSRYTVRNFLDISHLAEPMAATEL